MSNASDSVLYFPSIEFADVAWVKSSLLLWDTVYRIVPAGYTPEDSDEIRAAVDQGRVRSITLEAEDRAEATTEFLAFYDGCRCRPAGWESDEYAWLHRDKVDERLYPLLDALADRLDDGFLRLPRGVARGYVFYLSKYVALRRNLPRATEDRDSWTVAPYVTEGGDFDEFVYNREAPGFYCGIILESLIPASIGDVPMAKVIEFAERRRDERAVLRQRMHEFSSELTHCESIGFVRERLGQFTADLERAKDDFRRSIGFGNPGELYALLTIGMSVAASVLGMWAGARPDLDPYGLWRFGSTTLISAVAARAQYSSVRRAQQGSSYASYLIDLDTKLANRHGYPRYAAIFNEFMND